MKDFGNVKPSTRHSPDGRRSKPNVRPFGVPVKPGPPPTRLRTVSGRAEVKARGVDPELPLIHADLASAYALKGDQERAAAELAQARKLSSDNRYSGVASLKAHGIYFYEPRKVQAMSEASVYAGLRKAGMPEN